MLNQKLLETMGNENGLRVGPRRLSPCKGTAATQPGLPEGVGKGYVNAEVTL